MKRNWTLEKRTLDHYDLDESLDGLIEMLTSYKDEMEALGCEDIQSTFDSYPYYDSTETTWTLIGKRPMTDAEKAQAAAKRKAEKVAAEAKKVKDEAKERAEFERLKAKYDK